MQKTKFYIFILIVLLLVSAISLTAVILRFSPEQGLVLAWFYLSLAGLVFSALSLGGFSIRRARGMRELYGQYLANAMRQAFLLSLVLLVSFFLLSQNWFNWPSAILLVLAMASLEAYWVIQKNHKM